MKYEIEIELPEHLRDKWRPVAFRNAQAGEFGFALWSGQIHKIFKAPIAMANCLIVEPIDSVCANPWSEQQ